MAVYMLKFTGKVGGRAQYYIGYCADGRVQERYQEHITGRGAAICRAAVEQGHSILLAHIFPGAGRDLEFYLKSQHNAGAILHRIYCKTFKLPTEEQLSAAVEKRKRRYLVAD